MNQMHIEQAAVIDAHPQEVYAVISDYRVGHQAILPRPFFSEMIVKQGG